MHGVVLRTRKPINRGSITLGTIERHQRAELQRGAQAAAQRGCCPVSRCAPGQDAPAVSGPDSTTGVSATSLALLRRSRSIGRHAEQGLGAGHAGGVDPDLHARSQLRRRNSPMMVKSSGAASAVASGGNRPLEPSAAMMPSVSRNPRPSTSAISIWLPPPDLRESVAAVGIASRQHDEHAERRRERAIQSGLVVAEGL